MVSSGDFCFPVEDVSHIAGLLYPYALRNITGPSVLESDPEQDVSTQPAASTRRRCRIREEEKFAAYPARERINHDTDARGRKRYQVRESYKGELDDFNRLSDLRPLEGPEEQLKEHETKMMRRNLARIA